MKTYFNYIFPSFFPQFHSFFIKYPQEGVRAYLNYITRILGGLYVICGILLYLARPPHFKNWFLGYVATIWI